MATVGVEAGEVEGLFPSTQRPNLNRQPFTDRTLSKNNVRANHAHGKVQGGSSASGLPMKDAETTATSFEKTSNPTSGYTQPHGITNQELPNTGAAALTGVRTDPSNSNSGPNPTSPSRCWCLQDFNVGHKLGKGKFGVVYYAEERRSGLPIALKVIKKDLVQEQQATQLLKNEIEIHSRLRHSNIVRMYGYFVDKDRVYLILEYAAGGNLYQKLQAEKTFSEEKTAKYISSVASVLAYLHQSGVMHRDLKPENLLLDHEDNVKVADFGSCIRISDTERRTTLCGTLDYLPPEVITEVGYSKQVDLWCLGIVLYEFLLGYPPFLTAGPVVQTIERIKQGEVEFPPPPPQPQPPSVQAATTAPSAAAVDLIQKLLTKDAQQRYTAEQVLQHPWLQLQPQQYNNNPTITVTSSTTTPPHPHSHSQTQHLPAAASPQNENAPALTNACGLQPPLPHEQGRKRKQM